MLLFHLQILYNCTTVTFKIKYSSTACVNGKVSTDSYCISLTINDNSRAGIWGNFYEENFMGSGV